MAYLILEDGRRIVVGDKVALYLIRCIFENKHPEKTSKIKTFEFEQPGYTKFKQIGLALKANH